MERSLFKKAGYPLIAPLRLSFGFNSDIYNKHQR